MVLVQSCIQVNIVYAILCEYPLSAQVLTLNTDHSPADLVSGEVTDQSREVRYPCKQVCHSTALKIDNEETYILRAEIDRQRQNISL